MNVWKQSEEQERELYLKLTSKGGIAEKYYQIAQEKFSEYQDEITCVGFVYDNNEDDMRKVCSFADLIEKALNKVRNAGIEINLEDLQQNNNAVRAAYEEIEKISGQVIFNMPIILQNIVTYFKIVKDAYVHMKLLVKDYSYADGISMYMNGTIRQSKSFFRYDDAKRYLIAAKMNQRDERISRLFRFKELNAMDFLIQKEQELIIEALYFFFCTPIRVAEESDETACDV